MSRSGRLKAHSAARGGDLNFHADPDATAIAVSYPDQEALAIASPLFIHTSHDSVKQLITSVRRLTVIQTLVRLSIKQSIQQS